MLIEEFGTAKDEDVVRQIMEKGEIQESEVRSNLAPLFFRLLFLIEWITDGYIEIYRTPNGLVLGMK